jgi:hypothetical protein
LDAARAVCNIETVLNYHELDELSLDFAKAVFSAFPDWERGARVMRNDETGLSSLEVDVVQEITGRVLHLSSIGDEITLAFEHWHTHVGPFLGIDVAESIATAMGIIKDFISEETVVTITDRGGLWIGSSLQYRAAPGEPEPNSTTRIYSWRGTYDKVVENQP